MRVFACFFVIFGHIANWYMREYPDLPMTSYAVSLMINGICRISVPIFFMISGALILEKPVDLKKNTMRSAGMLIRTVIWTVVYVVWDYFYLGDNYYLNTIFAVPVRTHFWFMYVMVGICITTPFWQKLVRGSSKELMYYFSIIFIGNMAVTFILSRLNMNVTYDIPLIGNCVYVGYFIMGYVIRHYINEIKIKNWVCFAVLVLCVTLTNLYTYYYTVKLGVHCEAYSDFRSVFIGIAAMIVFYFTLKLKEPKHRSWVTFISGHSFNIYMMHVFFLDILQENIDVTKVNVFLGTPVFFVFMLSLSIAFSWIYERAKGKKQILL